MQERNRLHMYEVCCFNHYEVRLLPPSTAPQGTHRAASRCCLHTNVPLTYTCIWHLRGFLLWVFGGFALCLT